MVVEEARTIIGFIYNHGYVMPVMRERCGCDIVWLCVTCFTTNYIALQNILNNKVDLKTLFIHLNSLTTGRRTSGMICSRIDYV